MKSLKNILIINSKRIVILFATLAFLVGLFAVPFSVSADTNTLSPVSYTTTTGTSGGQPVANLAVQDQSGTANDWDKYVEFTGSYAGYRSYTVPSGITPSSITAIQVQANYQGPSKSNQAWTWKIYNWSTSAWVTLGDNATAPNWGAWTLFTFNASGTFSDYVHSSTREIRIQVASNNASDAMDLDYEAVSLTYSSGPTSTPTATATETPTPTNTPLGPTATFTATNTPTAMPTNTPASCGTICNQQATNDGTNVYYSFSYTGSFSFFRVYIDTDQNTATGYNANGIGANYMVENNNLYSHPANNSTWSWTSLGTVTFSSSGGVASWTIARSAIGETADPNVANLVFQVESPLSTTGTYTHTYSGGGPTLTPTNTPGGSTTVNYTASTSVITNPERGFDHTNGACEGGVMYNQTTLQNYRTNENISLVVCVFYLTGLQNSSIPQSVLDTLQTQLDTIRAAGLKVILRFAYTKSTAGDDASLAQIQAHLDQLAPYFSANKDVIYVLQSGFVGAWGEGYYTQNFGNAGTISSTDWANRKAVVDKELSVLPSNIMVQLRTPLFKTSMYGTTTVDASTAFNGSAIARIGHHNDAFLADATDWGTYTNTSVDYPYLQAETTYLPMGGEAEYGDETRAQCSTALSEMAMFHWSYVNVDYNPTTVSGWSSGNCLTTMQKNLGYRFVLTQGTYPTHASAGGSLNVQISIRNDGYAAPFNPRGRELILRNTSTGALYRFPLTSDPRFWLAGTTTTINQTITLPTNIPNGTYALLLNLPDPESSLNTRPEYSIQTANTNTWEASTGFNNLLHTVTIP